MLCQNNIVIKKLKLEIENCLKLKKHNHLFFQFLYLATILAVPSFLKATWLMSLPPSLMQSFLITPSQLKPLPLYKMKCLYWNVQINLTDWQSLSLSTSAKLTKLGFYDRVSVLHQHHITELFHDFNIIRGTDSFTLLPLSFQQNL